MRRTDTGSPRWRNNLKSLRESVRQGGSRQREHADSEKRRAGWGTVERTFQAQQEGLTPPHPGHGVGLPDAHSPLAAAWASGPDGAGAVSGA